MRCQFNRAPYTYIKIKKRGVSAIDVQTVTNYLTQYGAIAVFVIVFLEYLSLPGFPAGIIMPVAGICAAQGGMSLWATIVLSVLAGLCGSWMLYWLGRL